METSIQNTEIKTQISELSKAETKQLQILYDNPFVLIEDTDTYSLAKSSRTNLVTARTDIEKQHKVINRMINDTKSEVKELADSLIAITLEAEQAQKDEIARYEAEKQRIKAEKAAKEKARTDAHLKLMDEILSKISDHINNATFESLESSEKEISQIVSSLSSLDLEEFTDELVYKASVLQANFKANASKIKEDHRIKMEQQAIAEEQAAEAKRLADARAKFEAEQQAIRDAEASRQAKIDAEIQAKRYAEEEKLKAERAAFEQEKAEQEAKIRAEQEERDRQLQEEAAQKREEEHQARIEAMKPDADRLHSMVESLAFGVVLQDTATDEGGKVLIRIIEETEQFITTLYELVNTLK